VAAAADETTESAEDQERAKRDRDDVERAPDRLPSGARDRAGRAEHQQHVLEQHVAATAPPRAQEPGGDEQRQRRDEHAGQHRQRQSEREPTRGQQSPRNRDAARAEDQVGRRYDAE
jgi:hypothetical protein